jgi:hypothetical protein
MKNREKIIGWSFIQEITDLAIEIQNKGIATVFIELSGHVNHITVAIHAPVWLPSVPPTKRISAYVEEMEGYETDLQKIVDELKAILETPSMLPSLEDVKAKRKMELQLELEKLEAETI